MLKVTETQLAKTMVQLIDLSYELEFTSKSLSGRDETSSGS